MDNFDKKIQLFIEYMVEYDGYKKVIEGLQNTIIIAVMGHIIGIIIGTLIAAVRTVPKY